MAIKITVSNKVKFKVEGKLKGESGADEAFSFTLVCRRLDVDGLDERITQGGDAKVVDFLIDVTDDWLDVKDEAGKPVAYSEDAMRELCKIPGLAVLMFQTYLREVSAKAKN